MTFTHFFKPLLPDFTSGVDIPLTFFFKNIEGRTDLKTVELRSEASDRKWWVKLDGKRLTKGWKEFAEAHQFRTGDILVFRYIGDLIFIVFGFGISCCEIQYVHSSENCGDDNDEEEEEKMTREDRCVSLTVTKDTLKRSRIFLPKQFASTNGLENIASETISLMNEGGVKWHVKLVKEFGDTRQRMRLTVGLAEFLKANNVRANNTLGLELIWENATTPVLKLFSKTKHCTSGSSRPS